MFQSRILPVLALLALSACGQATSEVPDPRENQVELVARPPQAPKSEPAPEPVTASEGQCTVVGESASAVSFDCAGGSSEDCVSAAIHDYPRALQAYRDQHGVQVTHLAVFARRGSSCGVIAHLARR